MHNTMARLSVDLAQHLFEAQMGEYLDSLAHIMT